MIEMAVTVDDLPVHGIAHPDLSRNQVADMAIAALTKHNVRACGFVNGGQLASPEVVRVLKAVHRLPGGGRIGRVLCRAGVLDPRPYLSRQFPDVKLEYRAILERWLAAGQELGNHGYWHSNINLVPISTFTTGISKNQQLLLTLNRKQDKVFRYPYLREGCTAEQRRSVRSYLDKNGYKIAQVTVSFKDWTWNRPFVKRISQGKVDDVHRIKAAFLKVAQMRLEWSVNTAQQLVGRPIKHILLLHLSSFTASVLDELLSTYSAMGVKFITLEEAMSDPVYTIDPNVLSEKGCTFLEQLFLSERCYLD